jgi:6-phosphogluconolactonase
MKFRKFGKALLMSALSLGAVLSVTSCVQSYTVGFLYVTGTQTSGTTGQGVISGFKIDHNTGKLTAINGLPLASGGANPERAVLITGSRFLYVLNKGTDACVTDQPCSPTASIVQFAVGGNGILSQQETFFTQGYNPFRMFADSTGAHLFVLDHDVPSSASCALTLGSGVSACGDITAFNIDSTTGRLSLIENAQVSSVTTGAPLPYFPVPAEPIDFVFSNGYILTLSGTPTAGDEVFPYAYNAGNGQLTIGQNTSQPLNIFNATAIQTASSFVYVLDNETLIIPPNDAGSLFPAGTYPSQIIPFSVGTGGSLQAQTGGAVPTDAGGTDPLFILVESKSKWAYVSNYGNNSSTTNSQSDITGYDINTTTKQLIPMPGSPFGSGAGPRCLVEDPSNNFIYTANFNDSTVTGHTLDQNEGVLKDLPGNANKAYSLPGPATYCVIDGRTS